jgi:hypothetical protein
MPTEWFPGATRTPGAAAGWAKGRTPVRTVVCHYTVGRNSDAIGRQGIFHWLVRRDGEIVQYCETSALAWHAGNEGNPLGPGIEVEYLPGVDDTIFTPEALAATGALVRWLIDEWGVAPVYIDPVDRLALPLPNGFVAHRSLPNQDHTDYWPREDWAQMLATPRPPEKTRMKPVLFVDAAGRVWVYDPNAHTKTWVRSPEALNQIAALWAISGVDATLHNNLEQMVADAVEVKAGATGPGPAPGSLSDADVARIAATVADTLAKRLVS